MSDKWYYTKGSERLGPVEEEQLQQLLASSEGQSIDLVWKKGMAEWKKPVDVGFPMPASAASATDSPPPLVPEQWYYTQGGQRSGPVTEDELRQRVSSGKLQPTDLVWRKGMAEWQKAVDVGILPPSGPDVPKPAIVVKPKSPPPPASKLFVGAAIAVLSVALVALIWKAVSMVMETRAQTAATIQDIKEQGQYQEELMERGTERAIRGLKEKAAPADSDRVPHGSAWHNPRGDESTILDRDKFKTLVIGKTKEQIVALLGKPEKTFEVAPWEYWDYKKRTKDSVTDKVDGTAELLIQDGQVGAVSFLPY